MIDSHAHIYLKEFDSDIDEVIRRSKEAGVDQILLPNIDVSSISQLKDLVKAYPESVKGMMGLHPGSVKEDYEAELKKIKEEFKERNAS